MSITARQRKQVSGGKLAIAGGNTNKNANISFSLYADDALQKRKTQEQKRTGRQMQDQIQQVKMQKESNLLHCDKELCTADFNESH